jgi:HK97 family phage major capsid protein
MNARQIREGVRKTLRALLDQRAVATTALDTLRSDSAATPEAITTATEARNAHDAEIDALAARDAELTTEIEREDAMSALMNRAAPAPAPGEVRQPGDGVITSEPRTYSREADRAGKASFFSDLYRVSEGRFNPKAAERLARHDREVEVEREQLSQSRNGQQTDRATTTSSFAGLIPPQYLVNQAALLMRAGRPVANSVVGLELPDTGMSFVIPRGTTGASAAVQATQNSNVSNTDEVFSDLTVPVATIAGQQDVSRQSLERGTPGIDQMIYMDIAGAYGVALDQQVLSGTGSSGQMLGILSTSGVNQATAFTAAATAQTFYSKTAGQINAVQTTRFLSPTVIYCHPRRWNWLLTQFDSQNRPLVVPRDVAMNPLGTFSTLVDVADPMASGQLISLPVITDASIPTAVGTGPEDQVIVARREDLLLWEDGDGMPRQLQFEQTLGGQLTVKLVAYGYAAFTAGRYPTSVGIVGGNSASTFGLVAPTF